TKTKVSCADTLHRCCCFSCLFDILAAIRRARQVSFIRRGRDSCSSPAQGPLTGDGAKEHYHLRPIRYLRALPRYTLAIAFPPTPRRREYRQWLNSRFRRRGTWPRCFPYSPVAERPFHTAVLPRHWR